MSISDHDLLLVKKVLKLHDLWRGMNARVFVYKKHTTKDVPLDPIWFGSTGRENFVKWSLENGFEFNLYLDRRDNNKGYGPDNCQWITPYENKARKKTWLEFRRLTDNTFQSRK